MGYLSNLYTKLKTYTFTMKKTPKKKTCKRCKIDWPSQQIESESQICLLCWLQTHSHNSK